MVFTVRCYKCGAQAVRLVLGGRAILHARCHACSANLLSEVLEFEQAIREGLPANIGDESTEFTQDEPLKETPTSDITDEVDAVLAEEAEESSA